jgi:hypothetical protein
MHSIAEQLAVAIATARLHESLDDPRRPDLEIISQEPRRVAGLVCRLPGLVRDRGEVFVPAAIRPRAMDLGAHRFPGESFNSQAFLALLGCRPSSHGDP